MINRMTPWCQFLFLNLALIFNQPSAFAHEWLTATERQWIAEHPTIVLGTMSGLEPAIALREDGRFEGAVPDFLELVEKLTGLHIELRELAPQDIHRPILSSGIAGFVPFTRTGAVSQPGITLTRDIWKTLPAVYTRTDSSLDIQQLQDLRDLRIAYRQSIKSIEEYIAPVANVNQTTGVDSTLNGFTLLLENKVDAYVGLSTDSYQLSNYLISNIKTTFVDATAAIKAGIGISDTYPQLLSILNKTIDHIGSKRIAELSSHWLNPGPIHTVNSALTAQEFKWLEEHPRITLGFTDRFHPWLMQGTSKKSGIMVDITNELSQLLGMEIEIVVDQWDTIVQQVQQRTIDGILLTNKQLADELGLTLTEPAFFVPRIFYARADSQIKIHKPEDLIGKRIIYYSQTLFNSPLILSVADKITLIKMDNTMDGISALLRNEGDLLAGTTSDSYLIVSKNIPNLKPVYLQTNPDRLSLAIRNDWPELTTILNKAFAQISSERLLKIQQRWLGSAPVIDNTFSAAEMAYMKQLGSLRYDHRTAFIPLSFLDQRDNPAGIAADYMQIIGERLGIKLEPVINHETENLEPLKPLLENFVDISMILQDYPDLREYVAFSEPYINIPYVLTAHKDQPIIKSMEELIGMRIGVYRDSVAFRVLDEKLGNKIALLIYDDIVDAFRDIKRGKIDGFVENEIFMDYSLRSTAETDLKFAGTLPFTYSPAISVRKDMAALIPIINKVLAEISDRERALIYRRWVNFPIEKQVNWVKRISWISAISLAVLSILAAILYWNRKLALARAEAEQANRAKSLFLANMSHEIRTPMNAILGFAEIIQQDQALPEEHQHSLSVIRNAGNHLLSLINDILDISKIEAGRAVLNQTPCQLQKMLTDLEQLFLISAQRKGLSLSIQSVDTLPQVILTDEGKLRQILINLLGNAVKFTQQGGVHCRCKSALLADERVAITIQVADTGPGVDEPDRDKVFSTFEQTRTGSTEGGTGLGMAISKAYAQLMGGDITLQSEVGKGSCFTFTFTGEVALLTAEDTDTIVITGLNLGGRHPRALVVDDIATNRSLVINILKPLGFTIDEAEHGRAAINRYPIFKPDIVLMDIRMPEMDGLQATRHIRRLDPQVPIIAMTASVFHKDRENFQRAGFSAFLDKPFKRTDLLTVIADQLNLKLIHATTTATEKTSGDNNLPDGSARGKILIVDDVAVNRMLLDKVLTPFGYQCRHSENGRDALEQMRTWNPDLVLLDIQMPVMDGFEVLQQLQHSDIQRPPIVAVTAGDSPEEQQQLFALGVAGVFTKPINVEKVRTILRQTLPPRTAP